MGGKRRKREGRGRNSDITVMYLMHAGTHTPTQRVDGVIEYQGFVRVHMCVQRPIHVPQ